MIDRRFFARAASAAAWPGSGEPRCGLERTAAAVWRARWGGRAGAQALRPRHRRTARAGKAGRLGDSPMARTLAQCRAGYGPLHAILSSWPPSSVVAEGSQRCRPVASAGPAKQLPARTCGHVFPIKPRILVLQFFFTTWQNAPSCK